MKSRKNKSIAKNQQTIAKNKHITARYMSAYSLWLEDSFVQSHGYDKLFNEVTKKFKQWSCLESVLHSMGTALTNHGEHNINYILRLADAYHQDDNCKGFKEISRRVTPENVKVYPALFRQIVGNE